MVGLTFPLAGSLKLYGLSRAVLEGDERHGMIFFHQGDESDFLARRALKRPRPRRK